MAVRTSRKCSDVGSGFYKLLSEGDQVEERLDTELLRVDSEELPDGVFTVERLVEKRRRKVY